jgi:hypothetical protein
MEQTLRISERTFARRAKVPRASLDEKFKDVSFEFAVIYQHQVLTNISDIQLLTSGENDNLLLLGDHHEIKLQLWRRNTTIIQLLESRLAALQSVNGQWRLQSKVVSRLLFMCFCKLEVERLVRERSFQSVLLTLKLLFEPHMAQLHSLWQIIEKYDALSDFVDAEITNVNDLLDELLYLPSLEEITAEQPNIVDRCERLLVELSVRLVY